jgi:hypothetical protein
MPGQVIDRSVYQGSTYLGEHFDSPLTFDAAYTMPTPTTEAINPSTLAQSTIPNHFFMGHADGYWIYKLYNQGTLVKTVTLRDQDFYIPVVSDRVESVALTVTQGPEIPICEHDNHCPEPASAILLALSGAVIFGKTRKR